ncbi:MAG: type II secretion system F family protein [Candidatus Pacebacteria bacterium]|nr:type II secretion system F family protein [Candidatus Paceibacterota bacterium]
MPKFRFKAQKSSGEMYEGEGEAADKFALYRELKKEGETVFSATPLSVSHSKLSNSLTHAVDSFGSVNTHEQIMFARNLGSMMKGGLALSRALDVLSRQSKNKKLKAVLESLRGDISRGTSLSEAMKKFPKVFSPVFVFMTKAGEESGNLDESLKVVANQIERVYLLQKKIKGAMMYPGIIVTVMLIIAVLMFIFVVPTLASTFKDLGGELPLSTRFIIGISDVLVNHFFLSVGSFVVVLLLLLSFFRTGKGKRTMDILLLHLPLISGLTREVNAARITRTLASLLSAGVEVVTAITITADVIQNSYYKSALQASLVRVQKGESISSTFNGQEKLYPVFVGEMISVGEETGKLSEMLLQVAVFYEDDVDQKTKDISTIIEPFLMVMVGIAVGFFAVSILSPIYSLVGHIS